MGTCCESTQETINLPSGAVTTKNKARANVNKPRKAKVMLIDSVDEPEPTPMVSNKPTKSPKAKASKNAVNIAS